MTKLKTYGPILIILLLIAGYFIPKEKTTIKEKREEVRTIIETRPDGTKIVTKERIRVNTKIVTVRRPNRRYHIRLQTAFSRPSIDEIGLGYALTDNLAVEASYRLSEHIGGLSLIVRF